MAKNNHHNPTLVPTAIAVGILVIFSGLTPVWAEQGSRPAPTHTVKSGKATLNWHKAPEAMSKHSRLIASFKQVTDAHVAGGEPVVTPEASPLPVPRIRSSVTSNQRALSLRTAGEMLPLRPELMFSMFADGDGHSYCSDSTVVSTDRGDLQ